MKKLRAVYPLTKIARILVLVSFAVSTAGCAGLLVGGAATSVVVAYDERTAGTFIEDQAIELKALNAIRDKIELKEQTHISVTSYNQVALVTGQAPTEELRQSAISIISQIEKVRHVYDEIELVAPNSLVTRSSDSLLTAKVKTKLFTLKNIDATKVKIVSENGAVFLMGIVNRADGNTAADAASRVGGAQKIVKLFEYKD